MTKAKVTFPAEPGIEFWTESEDSAVQQSTIWTPNNAATDVNAVLLPKGTGANTAQSPDGTTTGGNSRGAYATDWQKFRTNANQVASGQWSSIIGGQSNISSADNSISGGRINTASGNESLSIGSVNVASATRAVSIGGVLNTASGSDSFVAGGGFNVAQSNSSFARGTRGFAYLKLMQSLGLSDQLNLLGGQQISTIPIYDRDDTDHTTGLSVLLGTLAAPDNNRAYNIVASWNAVVVGIAGTATGVNIGDYMTQCNLFGYKKVAGTGSITSITTVATHGDASMTGSAAMAYAVVGNDLNVSLTGPTFSGGGTLTIRCVVKLECVEIAWTV